MISVVQLPGTMGKITACVYSLLLERRRASNKFTGMFENVLYFGIRATNQNYFRKICVMFDAIQFGMILFPHLLCQKKKSIHNTLKTCAVVSLYIHAAHTDEIKTFQKNYVQLERERRTPTDAL
jgi:hypothetical protein